MKKQKILVTGGAGFIGSHIVDAYINNGHDVTVIDNLSTGKKEYINKKAEFFKIDICDKGVENIFKKNKFDIINHHAAQIDVRNSVADPVFDAKVNIMGSLNIFEKARKYGVKKVIFISSGGVLYGECKKPSKENFELKPLSPYGISKLTIEKYLQFYSNEKIFSYTILRYGNVYGPRQNPEGEAGVIAIFSKAMLKNKKLFIFGNGQQKRDFVYIKDIIRANLNALNNKGNQIVNIGQGKSISIIQLFNTMSKVFSYSKKPSKMPKRKGELHLSKLDIKKAKKILKWEPKYKIEKGLKETKDWYM